MKKCVVVGGGFKGILSSYLLCKAGHDVTLVERAPFLGGIMYSRECHGFFVDNGVHLFDSVQQHLADIVAEIMDGMTHTVSFDFASVYNRVTTYEFAQPDFTRLDLATRKAILYEVVENAAKEFSRPANLLELFRQRFGNTAASLMNESLTHIYRLDGQEIEAEAHAQTTFLRLRALPDEMALVLKKNPVLDDRLSALRARLGKINEYVSVYPSDKRGLRGFCEKSLEKLQKWGVDVRLKTSLKSLDTTSTGVEMVTEQGERITADHVIWTSDPGNLSQVWLGRDPISSLIHGTPSLLYTFITHVDRVLDCTYFHQFTPGAHVYRSAAAGRYSHQINDDGSTFVMCECPTDVDSERWVNAEKYAPAAWQECVDMGLIQGDMPPDASHVTKAKITYRLPKVGCTAACDELEEKIGETGSRIIMPLRSAFTRREIYYSLENLVDLVDSAPLRNVA